MILLADIQCNGDQALAKRTLLGFANSIPPYESWASEFALHQSGNLQIQYIPASSGKAQILRGDIIFGSVNADLTASDRATNPDIVALPFLVCVKSFRFLLFLSIS